MFAQGDVDDVCRAVQAMEAVELDAAEARHKLTRVQEAMTKVIRHFNTRMGSAGTTRMHFYLIPCFPIL